MTKRLGVAPAEHPFFVTLAKKSAFELPVLLADVAKTVAKPLEKENPRAILSKERRGGYAGGEGVR